MKIRQLLKNIYFTGFIVIVFLLIFAETNFLQNKNLFFEKIPLVSLMLASLGLTLCLWAFPSRSQKSWIRKSLLSLKTLLVLTVLFMIFAEAAMVDFSGILFGTEAIVHFSWQAIVLGVKEYIWAFIGLTVFLIIAVVSFYKAAHVLLSARSQLWVFLTGLVLLVSNFNHTVLGRYVAGYQAYAALNQLKSTSAAEMEALNALGLDALAVDKTEIQASVGNGKNLIILYLESFSELFTSSPRYPDLTPRINELKKQHQSLYPYTSTAKFTMDGLIGSNCGFVPNMALGNDALAGSDKQYYLIPCMSDVLKKAGYYQAFWGGAKKSFAGKGDFLTDHGFDEVWGWEDFQDLEQYQTAGSHSWWGLHDDDLFQKTMNRIHDLRNKPDPFHVSILTLSSHLKGFSAPSCRKYQTDSHRFLDAIYCTDQLVGDFIDQLKQTGVLDDTIVFITGDHGVFRTSLTTELFGQAIHNYNILGLLIDNEQHNNNIPMALYDMAPVMLDRLQIEHNVNFINGRSGPFSKDRLIISRNHFFKNGEPLQLDTQCDPSAAIHTQKPNKCSHHKVINTLHGYTQHFKISHALKFNADSELKVIFDAQKPILQDVTLNGLSLKERFTRDGFKLAGHNFASHDVFFIQFDIDSKSIVTHYLLNLDKPAASLTHFLKNQATQAYLVFANDLPQSAAFIQNLAAELNWQCVTDNFCANQLEQLGGLTTESHDKTIVLSFSD